MVKQTNLTKESGKTGTNISGGVITGEEYNPKLTGENALKTYNEMSLSDASVSAALEAVKLPITSADFEVDAASDDDADKEVAEFVKDCLFHIVDWDKFLDEALTFLEFGHDIHEAVYEPREVNGITRIALVKLGYRKQTTITKWETKDGQPGIQQLVDGEFLSIPEIKIVRFTRKQRGDNFQGISILRPAYKHWFIKDKLYRIDAVGHERHALGVIDITTPMGAKKADRDKLRRAARNMRANEQSYFEHPEGYTIEFMDMKANSLKDVEPSITHHDRQIMKNVLAQFLEMGGSGASGSRAVSEDHSRLFEKAVQNVANYIVNVLQNSVVRTLVDLNFTGREYPTLRVSSTSDENVTLISDAVAKFVTAGVIHPMGADENSTRKMIGWSQLDGGQLSEIDYTQKPAVLPTAGGVTAAAEIRSLRASVEKALYDETAKAA